MDELARLAAIVRKDATRAEASRAALYAAVRQALADGRTQAEIARVTGYSRERLRQIAQSGD